MVFRKVTQKAHQPFELDSTNTVSFDWKKNSGTKCTLKIKQINKSYADMFTIHVEIIIVIIFNCTWKKIINWIGKIYKFSAILSVDLVELVKNDWIIV